MSVCFLFLYLKVMLWALIRSTIAPLELSKLGNVFVHTYQFEQPLCYATTVTENSWELSAHIKSAVSQKCHMPNCHIPNF